MSKQKQSAEPKEKKSASRIFVADKIEMVETSKLKPFKTNPRNNDAAVDPVGQSFENYGMLVPIVINKKNEILAGETRWKAAVKHKLAKLPCVRAEHLSKWQQQQGFNIADNKVAEIATWNQDMLKDILAKIADESKGYDYTALGMTPAEVELYRTGWNSDAHRIGDIESEDTPAPGKIVILCKQDQEEEIRTQLQSFINDSALKDVTIK